MQSRNTYDLATAILFFDKLGRPGDEPLIQGMAIRLLGGQKKNGGWTYGSAAGPAVELPLETYMRSAINARKTAKPVPRTPRDLPAPVQQFLRAMGQPLPETGLGQSDGSNTQFAMLALWVARRHGLPVDQALLKVGDLFRKTQSKNGGWPYHLVPGEGENIRITMSCAGLLGIALEHGVAKKLKQERVPLAEDDAANNGLGLLGSYLATPSPESNRLLFVPGHFNYFLFSMERMAVVYDL